MKKLIIFFVSLFVFSLSSSFFVYAEESDAELAGSLSALTEASTDSTKYLTSVDNIFEKVPVDVFVRTGCGHCADEEDFFEELAGRRDDYIVNFHNIDNPEHYEHWQQLTEMDNLTKMTPITLVGNKIIMGFGEAETTGRIIEDAITKSKGKKTLTFAEYIEAGGMQNVEKLTAPGCFEETNICTDEGEDEPILQKIPFIGVVDLKDYSLGGMSLVLGFIDGFNPCAMWVLVTFLIVLIQAGSRRKMWVIAGIFIFAEAVMYYLILNVWYTSWDFVGMDRVITPIVGAIAVGGGLYFLNQFRKDDGTCKVTDAESKSRTVKKINKIVAAELTVVGILGILGLAFSVNIIEFACSIGIPQAFTKVLDINNLGFFERQFYMLLYIIMYMVDDLIVFGVALYSFEKIGLTTQKYVRWSHLFGGILMILLGLLLVFRAELLVF